MASESLSFDIFATDRASKSFREVGDAALRASGKIDVAAASLKVFDDATIKQGKAANTSIAAMKAHTQAANLLADAENVLAGRATKTTKLMTDQGREVDKAATRTENLGRAAGLAAGNLGPLGSGMGAAAVAGAALAPVIVTVATGLGGLGLAAYSVVKNQKLMHQVMAPLKADLASFDKALQPTVLQDFNAAIAAARPLLRGVEPVAAATGKALAQVLGEVGAEFRSGEFQQFFTFMARQAGPDVRLLGDTFVNLTKTLPPLLQDLQPLGHGLLVVGDDAAKAAHGLAGFWAAGQRDFPLSTKHTFNAVRDLDRWVVDITNHLPGGKAINDWITGKQRALDGTANAMRHTGTQAQAAAVHIQTMAQAVNALNTAENKTLSTQLAYANALITAANDGSALRQALRASAGEIGLHTAAQRASFTAANTFIADLANTASNAYSSGHGVDAAMRAIRTGLPTLDSAKTKNKLYWQEVATLKGWLDKLRLEKAIHENIAIGGSGAWRIITSSGQVRALGGHTGAAAGMLVTGGTPGRDSVPIMAMPGEAIVPKRLTPAVAPFLRANKVPGFASGGIVPGYSGSVGGLPMWAARNIDATGLVLAGQMAHAVTAAALAAVRAAQAAAQSAGGAGSNAVGGSNAANAALARRMMPAWATGMNWAAWNYVAMRESGWNRFARNPSSGAYGIPQALPATKLPFAGQAAGGSHAGPQISWMIGYMRGRYGGPIGAAAHERAFNWYDNGGYLPTGLSMALNTTGRPEPVGLAAGARGGGTTVVKVEVAPAVASANPALGRDIAQHLTAFLRHGGQLYPHGMTPR